jgi:hypothetical protein
MSGRYERERRMFTLRERAGCNSASPLLVLVALTPARDLLCRAKHLLSEVNWPLRRTSGGGGGPEKLEVSKGRARLGRDKSTEIQ